MSKPKQNKKINIEEYIEQLGSDNAPESLFVDFMQTTMRTLATNAGSSDLLANAIENVLQLPTSLIIMQQSKFEPFLNKFILDMLSQVDFDELARQEQEKIKEAAEKLKAQHQQDNKSVVFEEVQEEEKKPDELKQQPASSADKTEGDVDIDEVKEREAKKLNWQKECLSITSLLFNFCSFLGEFKLQPTSFKKHDVQWNVRLSAIGLDALLNSYFVKTFIAHTNSSYLTLWAHMIMRFATSVLSLHAPSHHQQQQQQQQKPSSQQEQEKQQQLEEQLEKVHVQLLEKVAHYCNDIMDKAKDTLDLNSKCVLLHHTAIVYKKQHQLQKAIQAFERVIKLRQAEGDKHSLGLIHVNFGNTCMEMASVSDAQYICEIGNQDKDTVLLSKEQLAVLNTAIDNFKKGEHLLQPQQQQKPKDSKQQQQSSAAEAEDSNKSQIETLSGDQYALALKNKAFALLNRAKVKQFQMKLSALDDLNDAIVSLTSAVKHFSQEMFPEQVKSFILLGECHYYLYLELKQALILLKGAETFSKFEKLISKERFPLLYFRLHKYTMLLLMELVKVVSTTDEKKAVEAKIAAEKDKIKDMKF